MVLSGSVLVLMPNRGIISEEGNPQSAPKGSSESADKHKSLFMFKKSEIASPISRKMKSLAFKVKHHSEKGEDTVIEGYIWKINLLQSFTLS